MLAISIFIISGVLLYKLLDINNYYLLIVLTLLLGGFSLYVIPNKKQGFSRHRFKTKRGKMLLADQILSQSKDAIITTDFDLNITSWNKGAEYLYGFTETEITGKQILNIIPSNYSQDQLKDIWKELKQKGSWKNVVIQQTKRKETITVLLSISVLKNNHDKITGFIGVCSDITNQIRAEERAEQFSYMIESSNDAMILFDENLIISYWNKGAERLYGYSKEESLNRIFGEFLAKQYTSVLLKETLKKITKRGYWKTEDIHYHKNGHPINVFVSFTPYITNEKNRIYIAVITDITEQKNAEQKLINYNQTLEKEVEEKTAQMREIFDRVDWGFIALDKSGNILFINPKASEIIKQKPSDVLNKNTWMVFDIKEQSAFYQTYLKAVYSQKTEYAEYFSDLLKRWMAAYIFPSKTGVSIYFRDITERKKMQDEIIRINNELRHLTEYQDKAIEEERKRVAGELHDELGQLITSIKLDADWLNRTITEERTEEKQKLKDIIELTSITAKKVRTIAQSLRPSILDDMGLIPAIEWQLVEFKKRSGIDVKFENSIGDMAFPEKISINLFRVLQESLTNIIRHSGATQVHCSIVINNSSLIMSISDNGKGFNKDDKKNTFGLLGMRERIKSIGGKFILKTALGEGTLETFVIPLTP